MSRRSLGRTFSATTNFATVNATALQVNGTDVGSTYATLATAQTISGAKTFSATTNFATVNATALQVNGTDISSTYATQKALNGKQKTLTKAATGTQLLSGTADRSLTAGSNVGVSLATDRLMFEPAASVRTVVPLNRGTLVEMTVSESC